MTEAAPEALQGFRRANPRLAQGYELKSRFQTRLADRARGALEPWLQQAEGSDRPSCQTLAQRFRQDSDALTAALTTPWRTGPCAGHIGRVKLLNRVGEGRAKVDLLRQRIGPRATGPRRAVQQRRTGDHHVAA